MPSSGIGTILSFNIADYENGTCTEVAGSVSWACSASGSWSLSTDTTHLVVCSKDANGALVTTGIPTGTSFTFQCPVGYTGTYTKTCLNNGSGVGDWTSNQASACTAVCTNGTINYPSCNQCQTGFAFNGTTCESIPNGVLCGISNYNHSGNYNIPVNGWSPPVNCRGNNPDTSCPSGFSKTNYLFNSLFYNTGTSVEYDTAYHCASADSNATLEGSLCGRANKNLNNGWSSSILCKGVNISTDADNCPSGYSKRSIQYNAGYDTAMFCVANGSIVQVSGTLCGAVSTYAGTYGAANSTSAGVIYCQGHNPKTSCPTGYTQKSIIANGGYTTIYHCVAN